MSKRVSWQCPRCGRSFRVPTSRPQPDVCRTCAGTQNSDQNQNSDQAAGIHFAEASNAQPTAQKSSAESLLSAPDSSSVAAGPVAAHGTTADQQTEILEQLKTISRTMTFFRRLVWGMILAMVCNVILMGAGAVYAIRMLGSVSGHMQSGESIRVDGLPVETRQQLQQIQEYSRTVNELLQETR